MYDNALVFAKDLTVMLIFSYDKTLVHLVIQKKNCTNAVFCVKIQPYVNMYYHLRWNQEGQKHTVNWGYRVWDLIVFT